MDDHDVTGNFERLADGSIEGWCWSAQRPRDRLAVDVLADAQVVATFVADRFRRDLVREGKGDGHHGFRLLAADVEIPDTTNLLSLRERDSRRIFARVRLNHRMIGNDPRLDRIEDEIILMRSTLPAPRSANGIADGVGAAFGAVGRRLTARRSGVIAAAHDIFARHSRSAGTSKFAVAAAPAHSLVIWAQDAAATFDLIASCRPILGRGDVELILADAGTDANVKLLAASFPNATFVAAPRARPFSAVVGDALAVARGRHAILLDATGSPTTGDSSGAMTALDTSLHLICRGAALIVGPRPACEAAAIGLVSQDSSVLNVPACMMSAVMFAIDMALVTVLGGFDPALDDDPSLAILDYASRASVAGVSPAWLVPPRGAARRPRVSAAWARFARRWNVDPEAAEPAVGS